MQTQATNGNGINILASLKEDLRIYEDTLVAVAKEVVKNDISNYPVFVAYKEPVPLGKQILERSVYKTNWNINASTLEELVAKKIIDIEKVDNFRHTYQDPTEKVCFLVIHNNNAQFVFVPYRPAPSG